MATLKEDRASVELGASYLSDTVGELLFAVAQIQEGAAFAEASWEQEPGEYRWQLHRAGDEVSLTVLGFDSSWPRPPEADGTVVFYCHSTINEVARVIARGFRQVLDEWGEEGYREKWVQHPFPTDLLELVERQAG